MKIVSPTVIDTLRRAYEGKRIECILMPEDPRPIEPGKRGDCTGIDGIGQLLMRWDDGRSLSLIPGVDKFKVVEGENVKANR